MAGLKVNRSPKVRPARSAARPDSAEKIHLPLAPIFSKILSVRTTAVRVNPGLFMKANLAQRDPLVTAVLKARTDARFLAAVEVLEREMYPEANGERVVLGHDGYYHFLPSWYVKSGAVTRALVAGLVSNKDRRVISIGAGAAHVERFLVRLGVSSDRIDLSDLNTDHLPAGFRTVAIDMFGEWPDSGERYDLVVFLESYFSRGRRADSLFHEQTEELRWIIVQAMRFVRAGGELIIHQSFIQPVLGPVTEMLSAAGYSLEMRDAQEFETPWVRVRHQ